MSLKHIFIKFLEITLYFHGVLHFFEFGLAIYEEAYLTASLAAFGAITMTLGGIFLGHSHHHTHQG